jgi:prepilin-type processing-associated H-X9-DG protein
MSRVRLILLALVVLALAGLLLPMILRGRANSDRIACANHLRELGLLGVRHASPPGQGLPTRPRDELPPGTFPNPSLPPDQRMSWYVYTLNELVEGVPTDDPTIKHRRPAGLGDLLAKFDATGRWDSERNSVLANYRLAAAICPAQVREYPAGSPVPTNYIAVGGLGLDTPAKPLDEAGPRAGAYRYDGPTPDSAIKDGLQQTAQIVETTADLGPWLRGGPSTLRGLDVAATPYVGPGRPFGGCHPGGVYVSFADGSVRFVKETVDPVVFRSMLTIAGGPGETNFDGP